MLVAIFLIVVCGPLLGLALYYWNRTPPGQLTENPFVDSAELRGVKAGAQRIRRSTNMALAGMLVVAALLILVGVDWIPVGIIGGVLAVAFIAVMFALDSAQKNFGKPPKD